MENVLGVRKRAVVWAVAICGYNIGYIFYSLSVFQSRVNIRS